MSYKKRAEQSIGQGTTTNSKHWNSHVKGVYPTHIEASSGPHLIDPSGKRYLDFICGLGTNLLGYGHPMVESEVSKYKFQGKSPSLPHVLEVEVAEQLKQMFPWTQRWKFLKSGSEACSAAVRMARAYNDRRLILSEGYHGWHDQFVSLTPPAKGVLPEHLIVPLEFNENLISHASAVIVEPIITDDSKDRIDKLRHLRKLCTEHGTMLIFDEVITGFRYQSHSVSKHHDIIPDLIIVGKAMANGYALAAVGGPKDILDNDYFVSSTYAGEVSALAASKAVMEIVRSKPDFAIANLWKAGEEFLEGFNQSAAHLGFQIEGYPTRGVFKGSELNIALFMQEACLAGLLFGKSWFISLSHLQHLKHALESCKDIMGKMEKSLPKLKGEMPKSPFSMRSRDGK